jgi:hypothetical protein
MRAVWTNIADIRKQEQRRTRLTIIVSVAAGVVALAVILFLVLR